MSSSPRRTAPRQPHGPSTTTAPASSGSQTITQPTTQNPNGNPTLRLRAQNASPPPASSSNNRRHIQWDESVIDNEGMGKKSSKVCCIYHAPHEPGDSESESSSSSSDSASDGEPDLSRAQRAGGRRRKGRDGSGDGGEGEGSGSGKGKERKASPNAYERQPKVKHKAKREG